jgi:hypothetical protein
MIDSHATPGESFSAHRARTVHVFSPVAIRFCMLDEFLSEHRAALIERCRSTAAARRVPDANGATLEHGIPLFLDQVITNQDVSKYTLCGDV